MKARKARSAEQENKIQQHSLAVLPAQRAAQTTLPAHPAARLCSGPTRDALDCLISPTLSGGCRATVLVGAVGVKARRQGCWRRASFLSCSVLVVGLRADFWRNALARPNNQHGGVDRRRRRADDDDKSHLWLSSREILVKTHPPPRSECGGSVDLCGLMDD